MDKPLGKIDKLLSVSYIGSKKLFLVPLIMYPQELETEMKDMLKMYWDQVEEQIARLETSLSTVTVIYHELLTESGEAGSGMIEKLNPVGYPVIKSKLELGCALELIEDRDNLAEFMDWARCLAIGIQSPKVFTRVYELYSDTQKARKENMLKCIVETLKEGESGLLIIREGHGLQFSNDVQVFYVAPPALNQVNSKLSQLITS
jgi:hypothetical protein